tara:strand:- start:1568 stop:2380 length:813 start_codon:yes stop_codon:yes gene_type:complete
MTLLLKVLLFFLAYINISNLSLLNIKDLKQLVKTSIFIENWRIQEPYLEKELQSKWIGIIKKNKLIAHKLGSYTNPNELTSSLKLDNNKLDILEVDLGLKKNYGLCILNKDKIKNNCDLNNLFNYIVNNNKYLIIDIKESDLYDSINLLNNKIKDYENPRKLSSLIIYQLYKPNDIKSFIKIVNKSNLKFNTPILTMYRSHSELKKVTEEIPDFIKVITIPLERKEQINDINKSIDILIMVHPLKTCKEYIKFKETYDLPVYGPSNLKNC